MITSNRADTDQHTTLMSLLYRLTTVTTTTSDNPNPPRILGQGINAILMPLQRAHKRLGEHSINLGRRHGSRILSCACEWMQRGVEVALNGVRGGRGRGKVVVQGPGDDFDLHG
jgi:hypothetical protein